MLGTLRYGTKSPFPGHDEYPKFDVDMETEMLGSVKPYGRQASCLFTRSGYW